MSKKIFNPQEWLSKPNTEQITFDSVEAQPTLAARQWATATPTQPANTIQQLPSLSSNNDIEEITCRIETAATDIAPNYADWRDLGFALADALGENGRQYYHRLSRFYSGYTETETDKQFSACLAAHGHGVTVKTLFHLAKQAGISVAVASQLAPQNFKSSISSKSATADIEDSAEMDKTETMPTFSEAVKDRLPSLLSQIVAKSVSPEDADLLLLGSLTVFSACLPNVYGIYGGREVFPNLFLFVTAQASAGKGR